MSSSLRPSKTENRLDFEVNQSSHGFSVGTPIYHNGTSYVASSASAESSSEILGVVSEVQDTNNFTLQTSGRIKGLSSLTAGTIYFLSETSGQVTDTPPTIKKPVYCAISTTEAIFLPYVGSTGSAGGSGDMVLISSATASSSSSIDFTGLSSTYFAYKLVYNLVSSVDGADIFLRTSSNNGSSYDNTSGNYIQPLHTNASATTFTTQTGIFLNTSSLGNVSNEAMAGEILIIDPSNTSEYTRIIGSTNYDTAAGAYIIHNYAATRTSTSAVNAIRVIPLTGIIASGTFKLYGLK